MRLPRVAIGRRERGRHVHVAHVAGLGVHEARFTERARIAIALRRDVHDEDVVPERPRES